MKPNPMIPTVRLKGKNPKFAIYGRIFALIAGLLFLVVAILNLISLSSFFFSLILAFNLFLIEEDKIDLAFLKSPLWRGATYLVFALVNSGFYNFFLFSMGGLASLFVLVAGILNIVYHFS